MNIDSDIPLCLSLAFIAGGLFLLAWSADRFVAAAGALARRFGVSPLIVGMVIIGFGTSAPELAVSVLSGLSGHSNLSLGNAYGSCIFNIAAILGIAAIVKPIAVKASVNFVAVPLLLGISILSYFLVRDGNFSRMNGVILLAVFAVLLPFYCWYDQMSHQETKEKETPKPPENVTFVTWLFLIGGLALLVASSHMLVWGCVDFARDILHVSDLMIGLTIVAMGTSLPELASAIASARRGEHEFVVGNIVGSNFFNTLAVVGLAGTISPFSNYSPYIVSRDLPAMVLTSLSIALFGLNYRHSSNGGRINRIEGVLWLVSFVVYLALVIIEEGQV